jgi:hypothetical protein
MNDQAEKNLMLWNSVNKTDPAHTKQFSRSGGFKGTAIKPYWLMQQATAKFGPCGIGWGWEETVVSATLFMLCRQAEQPFSGGLNFRLGDSRA